MTLMGIRAKSIESGSQFLWSMRTTSQQPRLGYHAACDLWVLNIMTCTCWINYYHYFARKRRRFGVLQLQKHNGLWAIPQDTAFSKRIFKNENAPCSAWVSRAVVLILRPAEHFYKRRSWNQFKNFKIWFICNTCKICMRWYMNFNICIKCIRYKCYAFEFVEVFLRKNCVRLCGPYLK